MEFKAPAFRYLAALWRADTSQTALYSFLQNSVLSLWNNAQSYGSTPGYTLSQSLSVCLCLSSYVHVCLLSLFSLSIQMPMGLGLRPCLDTKDPSASISLSIDLPLPLLVSHPFLQPLCCRLGGAAARWAGVCVATERSSHSHKRVRRDVRAGREGEETQAVTNNVPAMCLRASAL